MSIETCRSGRGNIGIEVGTQALDSEIKGNFATNPLIVSYMGGLGIVGTDDKIENTSIHFDEPPIDTLKENAKPGGIGNAAQFAIAPVLRATINETVNLTDEEKDAMRVYGWALMTTLGNDPVGDLWTKLIDDDIDKSHIKTKEGKRSGLSVIYTQQNKFKIDGTVIPAGERSIFYRPGACGETVFTKEDAEEIKKQNPFNVNISYPGLFRYGADLSQYNGENIAWFIQELQANNCPCVSMDTHGPTELRHIEKALPYIDMFNSNFDNAAKVFLGEKNKEGINEFSISDEKRMEYYEQIRKQIIDKSFTPESPQDRSRMFTITDSKGTYLILYNPHDKSIQSGYLPSTCASIEAKNKTGAGDVRFALQRLYIATLKNEKWQSGDLNWDDALTAVNIGQIGTAVFLQGKEKQHLDGISLYSLEKVANNRKEYQDIETLKAVLSNH